MITVIRTATAFPGMTGEAISWAKEVAALVKHVTGTEQIVCSSFGGMLAEIAWIGQYDSVGQYDEMRTKVLNDGEYRSALKKARDLFTPGSDRDQIWKHQYAANALRAMPSASSKLLRPSPPAGVSSAEGPLWLRGVLRRSTFR